MVIHPPKIQPVDDGILVSADIEFEQKSLGLPSTLWFKFPTECEAHLSDNMNGFVVCLFQLAMFLNEDLEVRGTISDRLFYNLKEVQRLLNFWHPEFSIITIKADGFTPQTVHAGNATMSAFSGGVDSFYTLLSHLPRNESSASHQISHTLFVEGFDRPLSEEKTHLALRQSFATLMQSLGITFIPASTNARDVYKGIDWDLSHDTVLTGAAHMLDGMVSRFYFAADETLPAHFKPHTFEFYTPTLGCLKTPLLSSDTLEIICHGTATPRVEKIHAISEWAETYKRLVVCWESHNGLHNCGICEKCVRTMTSLEIFDSLHKYETFPQPFKMKQIRKCKIDNELFFYHEWNIKYALKVGKRGLARNITYALWMNKYASIRSPFLPTRIPSFRKRKERMLS